jgi:flagellar hook assembly protein FlgD
MTAVGSPASAQTEPFDLRLSPDGGTRYLEPGQQGARFELCTTEPALVSIIIRDAQGALVRTFLDDAPWNDLCAEGFAFTDFWPTTDDNGNDVPDGVYTIEISGRTEAGETDAEMIQLGVIEDLVVGDFIPPNIVNGPFELQMFLNPDFTAIATVPEIRLLCHTGDGGTIPIGSVQFPASGVLAVVPGDSTPCPVGEHVLTCEMTWIDPFDVTHERTCGGWEITFEPPPPSFEIGLVENYSHPEEYRFPFDGGGLAFCLSRSGTVDAVVRNSAGGVMRTLASDQAFTASSCNSNPPVTSLSWDLRDDGGTLVPDGDYAITVSATETSNPSATAELTVTWHVSSLTPGEFVSPVPGQFVAGPETYEFHPTPGFTALYPLVISKPCTTFGFDVLPLGDDPFSGTWNAKSCGDGSHDVQFAVLFLDPLGQVHLDNTFIPLTIFHPDLTPGVALGSEGDSGTTTIDVPVTLSAPSQQEVRVTWRAVDGTATAGDDFETVASGTAVIPPGATETTVPITILGDDVAEADESVFVRFGEANTARTKGIFGVGFAVIADDDGPVVRAGTVEVTEADGDTTIEVPLTLSEPSSEAVTVDWRTVNNSAAAPGDYAAATGTATFQPGQTQTTLPITLRGDDLAEPREVVVVALSNAQNASVGGWLGLGFALVTDYD